jgi:orotate phosphoribosyltransferase
VQYVRETLKLQVCAIAALSDLLSYLAADQASNTEMQAHFERVQAYRARYGVAD